MRKYHNYPLSMGSGSATLYNANYATLCDVCVRADEEIDLRARVLIAP
jgi:hypothetical protein